MLLLYNTSIRNWNDILQRKDQQALRVIINFASYTVYAFVSLVKLNTILYMLQSKSLITYKSTWNSISFKHHCLIYRHSDDTLFY